MPPADALTMSIGIGMWFGFSIPMFIHVGIIVLSPLDHIHSKRRSQQILEVFFRLAGMAIGIAAIAAFAIFQGHANPAKDSVLYGILGGVVLYFVMFQCYKKLKALRDRS